MTATTEETTCHCPNCTDTCQSCTCENCTCESCNRAA